MRKRHLLRLLALAIAVYFKKSHWETLRQYP